ncbi:hypothetical protein K439DRAFT_1627613 [Ramaria rubella]|nr:hypothetical protein K439DRAFT_1627613 [Ramaria rubella]
MFFSVLDRKIHTPARVLRTSAFLYTTICAVASRHYTPQPTLYPLLLEHAKRAAGTALNGRKSKTIETCQAYLLLGVYVPPSRTFREDRAWVFYGLAIRIATDLGLHLPERPHTQEQLDDDPDLPTAEYHERLRLNRARAWLNCFCTDRSIATQLGKPPAIVMRSPVPFDLRVWWRASPWNMEGDLHMCAYASLLLVMAGFHEVVYGDAYGEDGAKKILDLCVVQSYADKVTAVGAEWQALLDEVDFPDRDPVMRWRDNLWPFLVSYSKLVVLSIGLRDGMRQGMRHNNPFSDQCVEAASDVLTQVLDRLARLGYMRYCVEAYFVFMGFAAAFLLKILRPKFSFMMRPGREAEITALVQRLVDLLGSEEVAINARHTPKLYSRFLADVLAKHTQEQARKADAKPAAASSSTSASASIPPAVGFASVDTYASEPLLHQQPQTQGLLPPPPLPQPHPWHYSSFAAFSQPHQYTNAHSLPHTHPQPASSYMDVDPPGPELMTPRDMDVMFASMAPLTDPYWEHSSMPGPGFAWVPPDGGGFMGMGSGGSGSGGGGGIGGTAAGTEYEMGDNVAGYVGGSGFGGAGAGMAMYGGASVYADAGAGFSAHI